MRPETTLSEEKFSHVRIRRLVRLPLATVESREMPLYSSASRSVRASPSSLFITPHKPLHHRLYSSPSQYNANRSQFKVLPILAIIALSSASYVFLVRSRAGAQSPQRKVSRSSEE